MSAAKARKPRTTTPKPAAETLPLADVSITIAKPKLFTNEEETVTFDGERLAEALRYVALSCPNLERFTDASYSAIELAGIAETCKGLSDANPGEIDSPAVFHALYRRLDDLASRINAGEHNYTKMTHVTITRKPAAEVA
jgi:hypothetical protein